MDKGACHHLSGIRVSTKNELRAFCQPKLMPPSLTVHNLCTMCSSRLWKSNPAGHPTSPISWTGWLCQSAKKIIVPGVVEVEGAAVHVEITTANDKINTYDGTTDVNGAVEFRYRVNSRKGGVGTYTVEATASKSGYTGGSGSTSFEVTG